MRYDFGVYFFSCKWSYAVVIYATFTNMDLLEHQHEYIITSIVQCNLLIISQTSMVQPTTHLTEQVITYTCWY